MVSGLIMIFVSIMAPFMLYCFTGFNQNYTMIKSMWTLKHTCNGLSSQLTFLLQLSGCCKMFILWSVLHLGYCCCLVSFKSVHTILEAQIMCYCKSVLESYLSSQPQAAHFWYWSGVWRRIWQELRLAHNHSFSPYRLDTACWWREQIR